LVGLRARPDPHLNRAALDPFDAHLGQVRQQDLKTVIIAPVAPYTVDDRSRRRDQPRSTKVGQIQSSASVDNPERIHVLGQIFVHAHAADRALPP
jgi:hypothetical protein